MGKHFADINEDQFDFHSYCIRKMTLRAYVGMLRLEDQLYSQAFYGKAAWGAVQCYLSLHDAPISAAAQEAADEAALAAMTPEERKKEKLRRKKVRAACGESGCFVLLWSSHVREVKADHGVLLFSADVYCDKHL